MKERWERVTERKKKIERERERAVMTSFIMYVRFKCIIWFKNEMTF